jgi:hypothetical protein
MPHHLHAMAGSRDARPVNPEVAGSSPVEPAIQISDLGGGPICPPVLLSEVRPSALRTAFPLPAQEVLDLSHQFFRVEFFAR